MKKESYVYVAVISLWLTFISYSSTATNDGFYVLLGEFIGYYLFVLGCIWIYGKVKRDKKETY
jgi:hypothetical protein